MERSNTITGVPIRERGRRIKRRRRDERCRGRGDAGPRVKEYGQPLRAGKGRGNRFFPIFSRRNKTWLTYFELLFPEL